MKNQMLDKFVASFVAELERLRGQREQIAQAVEQSAFCYSGTCATRLVPSASGEAATHVVAAYIRALDLRDEQEIEAERLNQQQAREKSDG